MNMKDFLPNGHEAQAPRALQPLWPICPCMDEKSLKKHMAGIRAENTPKVRDAMAAHNMRRRKDLSDAAVLSASFTLALSDALNLCRDARRYLVAITILNLCAKLNDGEGKDELDFSNPEAVRNRSYEVKLNMEDLFSLTEDLFLHAATDLNKKG